MQLPLKEKKEEKREEKGKRKSEQFTLYTLAIHPTLLTFHSGDGCSEQLPPPLSDIIMCM